MSPLILTVEEHLRACTALCDALYYFAKAANDPLIHHIRGCQPVDIIQITPGFCIAVREHATAIVRTLPADAMNLSEAERDGRR